MAASKSKDKEDITAVILFDPEPRDGKTNFARVLANDLRKFKVSYLLADGKNALNARNYAVSKWDVSTTMALMRL